MKTERTPPPQQQSRVQDSASRSDEMSDSGASETTDRVERRTQVKIDHTQLTVKQPDSGNDRARQREGDPRKPHSCKAHSAQEDA